MPTIKMSQNDKQKSNKSSKCRDIDQTRLRDIDGQAAELVRDESSSDNCDDCADCGKPVLATHKSLQCDGCGFLHHASCENVRKELYALLCDLETGDSLLWLCKKCMVMHRKVFAKVKQSQEAVEKLEEAHKRLEEKVDNIMATVGKTSMDAAKVQECVEGALKSQSEEEKVEANDQKKRITNVIVHGLSEPTASTSKDREAEDKDMTEVLLHKLSCDTVSVKQVTRLGAPPDEGQVAKPRPLRITLETEDARNTVLRNAKNLKGKEGGWDRVFVHPDLTPKQREARKALIQELIARKNSGEGDLIIVNGRIVTRRKYGY